MPDNSLVCDCGSAFGELEKAFTAFNRLSSELQGSYQALEQRVARLTSELEDARRARQDAATEAQRTAERLRSLLATLPGGVVVVDDAGRIREHNRVAEEILGAELLDESWQRVRARRAEDAHVGRRRLADARRPQDRARRELAAARRAARSSY